MALTTDYHRCPRKGCDQMVHNRIFCCSADWFLLSIPARIAIGQTSDASPLAFSRRQAFARAFTEWKVLDGIHAN